MITHYTLQENDFVAIVYMLSVQKKYQNAILVIALTWDL